MGDLPGEHEDIGEGVQVTILVSQLSAAIALSIVVIHEHSRVLVGHHSPTLSKSTGNMTQQKI
jgi:hypothetical protein